MSESAARACYAAAHPLRILVAALRPSLECLESVSTVGERGVDSVQWLAMVRRNLREREREAVATASSSKHEPGSRMPGHRDEKSLGGSRDLQEAGSDLAVGSSRIDKDADDRALRPQKIDDLSLRLNRRPTTVDPDGKAVPGNRLLQRSRCGPIVADGERHEVARKIAEYADAVELVRVPGKADDRSRPVLEQSDQLFDIRLPPNSTRSPRGVQADRRRQIRNVDQRLQHEIQCSRSIGCI